MEELKNLFFDCFGVNAFTCVPLAGAGSSRRYFRLTDASASVTAVGTTGDDVSENRCFVSLAHRFRDAGLDCVPCVYAVTTDSCGYLQQDLGDTSLLDVIRAGDAAVVSRLVRMTLDNLVAMQRVPRSDWGESVRERPFDRRLIMWDLNYFKYDFLKVTGVLFDEHKLEDDFERLCDTLLAYDCRIEGFMMRDCQSRNVMIYNDKPYFIDFQGGRCGPSIYDAVSLLCQAKAGFSDDFRREMMQYYAECYAAHVRREQGDGCANGMALSPEDVLKNSDSWVLFRQLQVLGAYGLRGLIERKAHFLESISTGIVNLHKSLSGNLGKRYPELRRIAETLSVCKRFAVMRETDNVGKLTVTVFSFSYKKGYPEDLTGNGGGFMFDCRAMHNPGRYAEYRDKRGWDQEVIDFLEESGEVRPYLESVNNIVMPAVERYMQRGFTSLQIGFGCTGGQHRSVYCADKTAKAIADRYPGCHVRLIHREQGVERDFNGCGENAAADNIQDITHKRR